MIHARILAVCALGSLLGWPVHAGVSTEEAAKLKTVLTPLGAERAGNKDGTIPAWDGGETKGPAGYKSGDPRPDPYASEKPLATVSAKNLDSHQAKLSEGTKALLKKYPDQFRLEVYPTHRTVAAPQWVYDNTFKNATRAKQKEGGVWIEGAYGGIPFPIPKNGAEAMWNHLLAWVGSSTLITYQNWVGLADGRRSLCRNTAGIETDGRSYPQTALTFNLRHARPHNDISTEFHTENGPFTLVPLPGNRSNPRWWRS